jgi:hypothetical protein
LNFAPKPKQREVRSGSKARRGANVRFWADTVAKVENRTTLKISRKLIFRLLCCRVALQRRYEGPWSILDESIWSLTSPRSKRISSSKKFRSSPQKDFFNTIGRKADIRQVTRIGSAPKQTSKSGREAQPAVWSAFLLNSTCSG